MVARVTLAEIDTLRMPLSEAIEVFESRIAPALREQKGFEGVYVLATPEGKALVMTLWHDAEAAEAGVASGLYAEQVEQYVAVFRSPPGRELYDVVHAETPAGAAA
jgi:heme-degrading monooxygenase HmoA